MNVLVAPPLVLVAGPPVLSATHVGLILLLRAPLRIGRSSGRWRIASPGRGARSSSPAG
jgi:hypothetical protein